ncbi:hypothetical protein HMPREF9080_00243 [Cardiobacterium valvarum F0432]|uniref:Uncharacterized protein n=1 Tax=Cardiobacterium valvarum F0432 TaxID=797473 RepID=G9ZBW6_9GAMM|nr:hypothetical protein HMPREF9080_00243 [Cardiobacterium valvarum F0432]
MQFAGVFVLHKAQRHAPVALAGDAPVRAGGDHVGQAAAAPFGGEADVLQAIQRGLAQAILVHADKPLCGGTVDGRAVVSPAVRVAVADGGVVDEAVFFFEEFDDFGVGLEDVFAGEIGGIVGEAAIGQDRVHIHADTVVAADFKVFDTVRGGTVDAAGARIEGDVLTVDEQTVALDKGVGQDEAIQRFTAGGSDRLPRGFHAPALAYAVDEILGDDEVAAAVVDKGVFEFGVQGDGKVRGQGPRCGGPNDDIHGVRRGGEIHAASEVGGVAHGKAHVDGFRGFVFVFDFRFGQRGAAVQTPVDRFETAHHMAVSHNLAQGADDARFRLRLHGEIGVRPVAKDAEADEIGLLQLDLTCGITAAGGAKFRSAHLRTRLADFLLNLLLNRQAVAVPARDVRAIETEHLARFGDDVFQDFIEGMADVNRAVGVGRAVVQDEFRAARERCALFAVNIVVLPESEDFRLALRQIAAHREIGGGQIQSVFIVSHVVVPVE